MQATLWEFKNRWWVIFGIFFVAFNAYALDHANAGAAITEWAAGKHAPDNAYRVTFGVGSLLVAAAAFLRTWGTSYLRAEVMRDARVHTEKLLADGAYRYVRNPLYLGNILMAAGIGLMASRTGFLILTLGMTVFVLRLILREEAELARDQGEPYRQYSSAVPRLVPSLAPRVSPAGNAAQWGQGIRAELMYWMLALAMAAFAVTLNIKFFWGGFALAMVSMWFYKRPETSAAREPNDS